ncbi:MAG TPA: ectoine hydroxylase [Sunxiuqinia sp.]|nr:ectoine hydroxylase [Sunxiuqinia sp.]
MHEDIYPSRGGRKVQLAQRKDPVVYAGNTKDSPVSEKLIKQYEEQGFLILEDVFSQEEVASLQKEMERLKTDDDIKSSDHTITEPGSGNVRSVFKVHEISRVFQKLTSDKRLAGLAAYLLNDDVYIHQSRVNYKPGFKGKEFYWHSDFETWHVEDGMPRMRALSMSVALTDNYTYNGALMLVPGSHKRYVVCQGDTPENHFKSSLKKQEYGVPDNESLTTLIEEGGIVTATGKPGSVIIFDCNTMHGSNGNITPFPRSNIFFVYNAVSNKVVEPFCDQPPRPEYICTRENIKPVEHVDAEFATTEK